MVPASFSSGTGVMAGDEIDIDDDVGIGIAAIEKGQIESNISTTIEVPGILLQGNIIKIYLPQVDIAKEIEFPFNICSVSDNIQIWFCPKTFGFKIKKNKVLHMA
jgi:hypothetical protein